MQIMEGKIILITGSTQGIGLATAIKLFDLGATVVLNSPNADDASVLGHFDGNGRVRFFAADISVENSLSQLAGYIQI